MGLWVGDCPETSGCQAPNLILEHRSVSSIRVWSRWIRLIALPDSPIVLDSSDDEDHDATDHEDCNCGDDEDDEDDESSDEDYNLSDWMVWKTELMDDVEDKALDNPIYALKDRQWFLDPRIQYSRAEEPRGVHQPFVLLQDFWHFSTDDRLALLNVL